MYDCADGQAHSAGQIQAPAVQLMLGNIACHAARDPGGLTCVPCYQSEDLLRSYAMSQALLEPP